MCPRTRTAWGEGDGGPPGETEMKFLHTADWHVGKTLKARDRLEEQRAVLAEIADIAEANEVDAVLVAGDVYDLSAPSAPAPQVVVEALLRIARGGGGA